jgi:DNA-directed RNA polymerase specialized sigma24 family protein
MASATRPVSVVDPARTAPWTGSANTPPVLFKGPRRKTYKVAPGTTPNGTSDNLFAAMPIEAEGFDDFFAHVLPRTLRAARRLTGDPWAAEAVAVEALARAHARWERIAPLPWRDAWVLNAACKRALRSIRRHPPLSAAGRGGNVPESALRWHELIALLHQLPRRERETTVLRYVCELAEADVALALGVPARTVKAHLQSAGASLRASIDVDIEEVSVHEPHA